jgi:endoglucanase
MVKDSHICDQNGNPVQLRGMSMYAWTNAGGYAFYTAGTVNHLYSDWRCHIIRIPYMPNGSVPMAMYDAVIQACIDNGIYAILDWHPGDKTPVDQAVAFFKAMATKWGKYPNILYEPWNEPHGVQWSSAIKPYMETVIKAIRAIDTSNIIICGTPDWDQKPQDAAADPITISKNIAYTVHFYSGTHYLANMSPGITTAMNKGCAIFVTEYGACSIQPAPAQPECTKWYGFLDANSIGSCNWGVETQDQCLSIFVKGASTSGPWPENTLTADGKFVREYIMKGTDSPTGLLPGGAPFQYRVAPASKGLLTGVDAQSDVFSINGASCAADGMLPNGLYILRQGNEGKSGGSPYISRDE